MSILQRKFVWAILFVIGLVAVSSLFDTLAYCKVLKKIKSSLYFEVVLSSVVLIFIICAYLGTCIILTRRTWTHIGGRAFHSAHMVKARNRAIAKLLVILLAFIIVWAYNISVGIKSLINDDGLAIDVSFQCVPFAFVTWRSLNVHEYLKPFFAASFLFNRCRRPSCQFWIV